MKYIGKLNIQIFSCITRHPITDDVIITEERIDHIETRHPGDFECIFPNLQDALQTPDYILDDKGKQDTGLVLKKVDDVSLRFQIVIRVVTSKDNPNYKNSIISAWKISESRWKNYIKNKKILYNGISP